MERLKILTDADTGADDAVSILLGCAHADVLAISCTDGNVTGAI
jgi:inosine-uridine nucleoside N-ribohydrolase